MRRQGVRIAVSLSFLLLLIGLSTGPSHAQAHIDRALPSAPLPRTSLLTIFPEIDIVKDPTRPVPPLSARPKFEIAYHKICSPAWLPTLSRILHFSRRPTVVPRTARDGGLSDNASVTTPRTSPRSLFFLRGLCRRPSPGPAILPSGMVSVSRRERWILRSQVVAFSDRGKPYAQLREPARLWPSVALRNAYMHARSVSFVNNMNRYGISFASDIAVDTIYEFDLRRLLQRRLSQP